MNISPDNKNSKIGCVIMASGLGVRFGGNKLMAEFGGRPMVSWILDAAARTFEEVIVVTRNPGVEELCNSRGIKVIFHDYPYRSDTIRIGVSSLCSDVQGVVFCLADQPFLSADTLRKIIEKATAEPDSIWRTTCHGTIGSPTYFPKQFFDELCNLPQDKGGSFICKTHTEDVRNFAIENSLELRDIDTKETYEELAPLACSLNVWSEFLGTGKKHLFITGYRGAGKTTLINNLMPLIHSSSGLTSFAIKGVDVHLVNNSTKEEIVIGRFIPENKLANNKMTPDLETFAGQGVAFVNELIDSSDEWVTIDEIGYLEEFSEAYQDALLRLLDAKRVVAVIRKDDLTFLNELTGRGDAYVIDLDVRCERDIV